MGKLKELFLNILNNKKIIAVLMASISYTTMCLLGTIKTYDILSWLVFLGLIIIYYKTDIYNCKYKKDIIILSLIFSFILVFGNIVYTLQDNVMESSFNVLFSFRSLFYWLGQFNLLYILFANIIPKLIDMKLKLEKRNIKKNYIVFLCSFVIIFVCWIPYFLSFYPASLSPDSVSQLTMVINNFSSLSDNHPLLHGIFIAIPYNIGMTLFDSIYLAVACVSITQMIIMASIFSYLIIFLYKRGINKYILLGITCFYALLPMHGYYSITMWKDVIFSGLLLLLSIETFKILEKEHSNKLNFKTLIPFIIISLLCIFFRNNSIYMYYILAVISLILFRKHLKIFLISFIIVFGVFYGVKGPLFDYLEVKKSPSAEYIGIPLQQVGRMAFKGVEFTSSEKELLNQLMPIEIMADSYNPKLVDPIKFNEDFNREAFDENKEAYFKLWLQLVIKHPSVAVESYATSTLGYWYPGVEYWSVVREIYDNDYSLKSSSKVPSKIRNTLIEIESRNTPILNIEWSIGLCFWIIFILGYITVKRNGIKLLYSFIPVLGIWLTMMIASPVYGEFRYVYGAFTCLPLLMLMPYLFKEKREVNKMKIKKIYDKYQEIINYLIIGVLTTVVSLVTYYLCVFTILDPNNALELQIANVISWICSVAFAYITNRIFVFKSKTKQIFKEITSFISSRILTLLLDMGIMFLLVSWLGINDKLSKLVVQVIVIVLNYVLSKLFVFKINKRLDTKK